MNTLECQEQGPTWTDLRLRAPVNLYVPEAYTLTSLDAGALLRRERTALGFNQREVAILFGTHGSLVCMAEHGRYRSYALHLLACLRRTFRGALFEERRL